MSRERGHVSEQEAGNLDDILAHAQWEAEHAGAPGCPARERARATIALVLAHRRLVACEECYCHECGRGVRP